ncbi:hypothetical protein A1O1_02802 [Capronia coronata CBS 617.96]|uniref:Transcription factor domain-containing protein n=1 Tax=Capronia coronata CBS 617.96 TaxID=1182541 RepID=W9YPF4_9EURO|nr:uncharacterized protein A1O1_02802 [Capronia coronata CBS 617.96]EXJ94408.1 hypothetical protein A1O1_02802 [Capronia coronata CBS 617.96]
MVTEHGVYFDYFRHQVTNNLAGFYTTNIWSHLVGGECLQEDCIQHSVLAIGALMRSMSEGLPSSGEEDHNTVSQMLAFGKVAEQHHRAALRHYGKALNLLRQRIQCMVRSTPGAAVTTTLLLVVFELLQGRPDTAHSLVSLAIPLLEGRSPLFQSKHAPPAKSDPDPAFRDMEWVLPTISNMHRLSHSLRFPHETINFCTTETNFDFPDPGCDSMSKLFTCWGRFFTLSIIFFRQSIWYELEHMSADVPPSIALQQEMLLSHLQRWKHILADCAKRLQVEAAGKSALRIVQVHWLLLEIMISCCLDRAQLMFDRFEEEFSRLIALCVDLIQDPSCCRRPTSVLLGEGLILPLSITIRFCRNHNIRMRAIEAMNLIPGSIVAWDLRDMLDGLLGAVLLEELGRLSNGFVPPESRWVWLEGGQSKGGDQFVKVYQRLMPKEKGEIVFKELRVDTDLLPEICAVAGCTGDHSRAEV